MIIHWKRSCPTPLAVLFICSLFSSVVTADSALLPKELPPGWALADGPHRYTRANLFEHINGQAELFFSYGFRGSTFVVYKDLKNPDHQVDLDIYDMGDVLHAFGIFSRLRTEGRPGGLGLESQVDDHSLLFYKGKYFVMLYATEPDPAVLKQLASAVAYQISDASPPPKEIGFFPPEGLQPGSIQFFPEGLLGHRFLKNGFLGSYADGNQSFSLFLSVFPTPQEATRAFQAFKNYLSKRGKNVSDIQGEGGSPGFKGEDPYKGEVDVLQRGRHLLGSVGNGGGRQARLLSEFIRRIRH